MTLLCPGRHDEPTELERPHLCHDCRQRVHKHLSEIPSYANLLRAVTAGVSTHALGEQVSGSHEPGLPGGSVLALLGPAAPDTVHGSPDDQDGTVPVPSIIASWVRIMLDEAEWTNPAGDDLEAHCRWLKQRSEWACDQTWGPDFASEISDARSALRRAAGFRSQLVRQTALDCPVCDARGTIVDIPEDERRRCDSRAGGCGTVWTPAAWNDLKTPAVAAALQDAVEGRMSA